MIFINQFFVRSFRDHAQIYFGLDANDNSNFVPVLDRIVVTTRTFFSLKKLLNDFEVLKAIKEALPEYIKEDKDKVVVSAKATIINPIEQLANSQIFVEGFNVTCYSDYVLLKMLPMNLSIVFSYATFLRFAEIIDAIEMQGNPEDFEAVKSALDDYNAVMREKQFKEKEQELLNAQAKIDSLNITTPEIQDGEPLPTVDVEDGIVIEKDGRVKKKPTIALDLDELDDESSENTNDQDVDELPLFDSEEVVDGKMVTEEELENEEK